MTQIISVMNQKGGSGKTTTAINIAATIAMKNQKVLLLDTDPQKSAFDCSLMTSVKLFDTAVRDQKTITDGLHADYHEYDYVIVDSAPRLQKEMAAIIRVSDLILMPCMPSPLDIWACDDLVKAIHMRMDADNNLQAFFLINGANPSSTIQNDVLEAMEGLELPVLDNQVTARTAYRRSISEGISVIHSADQNAVREIELLTSEILECLG